MCTTLADRFLSSSGTGTESFSSPFEVMIVADNVTSSSFDATGFLRPPLDPLQSSHLLLAPFFHWFSLKELFGSGLLHLLHFLVGSDAAAPAGAGAGASSSPSLSPLLEASMARFFAPVPFFGLVCSGRLGGLFLGAAGRGCWPPEPRAPLFFLGIAAPCECFQVRDQCEYAVGGVFETGDLRRDLAACKTLGMPGST
jgi:hypothetical protein